MTRYLTLEDVLRFLESALGEEPQVRDFGLLEAALARPATTVMSEDAYPTIAGKAAALLHSLCRTTRSWTATSASPGRRRPSSWC